MDIISFVYSVLAFIAAIGILVTIHEFGHYWVARKCGVKVLRFSVGFGKPIWMKKAGVDQTEYALAAIPLGGYVKMLDEREGEVADEDLPRAFNRQSVSKRFAIVFAGPAFNFIFAIIAYTFMYMSGVSGLKPIIGEVINPSPAYSAGIQKKDLILTINGISTPSWEKARLTLLQESVDQSRLNISLQGADLQIREANIDTQQLSVLQDDQTDILEQIGLSVWRPDIPPQIDEVVVGGAAAAAGMQAGDIIISVEGQSIINVRQWVDIIRANPLNTLEVVVMRNGAKTRLDIQPREKTAEGETFGFIGVKNVVIIPEDMRQQLRVVEQYNFFGAGLEALNKTWQMSVLTLKVLGKLVIGEASFKNLSGPITIAKYAGLSARIGLEQFFSFLAIISISLGVLNLLPIPMLDGGHLLYYLVEILKGSPVSETVESVGQRIGLAVLLMLMTIAIYNDILRLVE
ncbi:MAG: RIP metalloprotease RseP [Gammaproteobacteria bacterium]|nr:RIP metalloprotease RseP [Gammaproteobacteria bacterium]